ncbi:prostaglandin E2 receptor EP4 subtype-like [Octopus sinensis]|uniref:Prostaglandin E2 receptor EP4 subtype-like n=1 Tax=Octopus sinensis TaxID=2607531 RepID=A0A6P7T352_9MOLL|nr:prostaglandin E2 receptor EP4 subtype-like [Octopus sinensis]
MNVGDYNSLTTHITISSTGSDMSNMSNEKFEEKKNHTVMVSSIMFGTGVFGNILALVSLASSKKEQRHTIFYKLAASLVVTDLLGTVATSPVVIATYNNNFKMPCGPALCSYLGFMMILAGFATQFIICTMALERYFCINHPCYYYIQPRKYYTRIALLFCWVGSSIIACLPFTGLGSIKLMDPGTWCFFDYHSKVAINMVFNFLYSILGIVTILTTVILNIAVLRKLISVRCKQTVVSSSTGKLRRIASSRRYTEIQMVVQLIMITCIFTTCYLPLMIHVFVNQLTSIQNKDLLVIRLASLNQILDPWVYILIRRSTVFQISRFFRFIFRVKPPLIIVNTSPLPVRRESSESTVSKMSLDGRKISLATNGMYRIQREDSTWSEFCWNCLCENPNDKYDHTVVAVTSSKKHIEKNQIQTSMKIVKKHTISHV